MLGPFLVTEMMQFGDTMGNPVELSDLIRDHRAALVERREKNPDVRVDYDPLRRQCSIGEEQTVHHKCG